MIVDDSAVVRQVLKEILNQSAHLDVYATANDPIAAQRKMQKCWPDVIVLDIEMPEMDGLTFLRKIMGERPTPVVICSSLAEKDTTLSISALEAGAMDIITKPQLSVKSFLNDIKKEIRDIILAAAQSDLSKFHHLKDNKPQTIPDEQDLTALASTTDKITAIGSSTGGTQALEYVLSELPRTCPGIVIVQHMPPNFTRSFATRLNEISRIEVKEAESGDRIIPGRAILAPGGEHLEVTRSGAQFITRVFSGPAVNRHCPSVDVLFRSVAKSVKQNAKGVIMTGMGSDGARGLLEMKHAGAYTIAQDEKTSVVYGMPKEAVKLGAASKITGLDKIPDLISS